MEEILAGMPAQWKDRVVLIQNELLPPKWEKFQLAPTVAVCWYEKKRGMDVKHGIASVAIGGR